MVKTQYIRALLLSAMILGLVPVAFAQDFGLIVGQSARLDSESNANAGSSTSMVPWFFMPLGTRAELYLSAGLTVEYPAEGWSPVDNIRLLPEVFRMELAFALSDTMGLSLGRIPFRDGQALVMNGLFDGASFFVDSWWGRLNAGVFYTGGLYKGTASINISPHDSVIMDNDDRYHASRRLAGGIGWEQTGIFDTRNTLRLSGMFQVDLNDADVQVHSQYLVVGASVPIGRSLNIETGAAVSLSQVLQPEAEQETDLLVGLAASLDLRWTHAGTTPGMVTVGWRFASGGSGEMGAFAPITGRSLGNVLQPDFSGIAMARIGYYIRLMQTLFAEVSASYLFRTDTVTFTDEGINSDSSFLGGEFFASLSWAPFSDLIFTLGGGVFLPGMGSAFASNESVRYRLEFTAGVSL